MLLQANMTNSEATIQYDVEDKRRRGTSGCTTRCSVGGGLTRPTTPEKKKGLLVIRLHRVEDVGCTVCVRVTRYGYIAARDWTTTRLELSSI